ncbi:cyclic peptide export ABC transporter [Microbulbifer epialgicus]|uniref:Cyclic peptide export ABC transporter n=1 Tax=Microbulbifer epialgicus TaxID=393907 RepID=A0ABV4P4C3_9GAMM
MKTSSSLNNIRLSRILSATAPNKVFVAILFGGISGLAYSLIIPLILLSLQDPLPRLLSAQEANSFYLFGNIEVSKPKIALAFLLVCIFILLSRSASQIILTRLATDVAVDFRKMLYHRIVQLPIRDLETIGPSRLLAAVTTDIPQIVSAAGVFPRILINSSILLGLLGYLFYLNIEIFYFIIGMMVFGSLTYRIPFILGERFMAKARNCHDVLQEGLRGLIYGAKDLKINKDRRWDFLEKKLEDVEENLRSYQKKGDSLVLFGVTYGDMIGFFSIGTVTFIMVNYHSFSKDILFGTVTVMLYITGPISMIINSIGPIIQAGVSKRKLEKLLNEMPIENYHATSKLPNFDSIELKNITYMYSRKQNEEDSFRVGPINLVFNRGEIIFLTGGNGSGKSTLAKLISLHYIPEQGEISFGSNIVTDENRDALRQSISAIYSDFYLFTELFGFNDRDIDYVANMYIDDLGLRGKVSIKEGKFSTTELSDGQKKRLALLIAYLEDREIFIFDEWAADQDPKFKGIFYKKIIPSLIKMNKIVIVISHDDRYFDNADKLIKMSAGKVIDVKQYVNGDLSSISHLDTYT